MTFSDIELIHRRCSKSRKGGEVFGAEPATRTYEVGTKYFKGGGGGQAYVWGEQKYSKYNKINKSENFTKIQK